MASTGAPRASRYFGRKRFQSSSPSPIRNIAPATATTLRSRPRKWETRWLRVAVVKAPAAMDESGSARLSLFPAQPALRLSRQLQIPVARQLLAVGIECHDRHAGRRGIAGGRELEYRGSLV